MLDDVWISVSDSLPGVGETVELKLLDGRVCMVRFSFSIGVISTMRDVTHWKRFMVFPERRPDFSRLNINDLVSITFMGGGNICGYIVKYKSDDQISIHPFEKQEWSGSCYTNPKKIIKKITRINLDEKKFEEI